MGARSGLGLPTGDGTGLVLPAQQSHDERTGSAHPGTAARNLTERPRWTGSVGGQRSLARTINLPCMQSTPAVPPAPDEPGPGESTPDVSGVDVSGVPAQSRGHGS